MQTTQYSLYQMFNQLWKPYWNCSHIIIIIQPLEQHPLPLEQSEKVNYLISLKHDFQTFMEDSPYYVKRNEGKKDIMRYSDKYKVSSNATSESGTICK